MVGPATGNALPVDYKLGEYTIQAVLGQGGFGITYLAHDTRLNTQVAIKEYFPQAYAARQSTSVIAAHDGKLQKENYEWGLNEFLKEAQALARFKHAHIVRVQRFLEANGTAYMVMEYEEGESLLGYLNHHGGLLPEPMLLGIFIPILTGMQAVHDAGVLHLDIKPDNIYLRKNGQPMLIDFGSSRQVREDADASQRVAISRGYAAPEQYPGNGERGPWSDVYGMGAALYRCITGREPMDALERKRAVQKTTLDPFAPASSFDRPHYASHIRATVDAALALKADDRPPSARALQNGLMGKEARDEQVKPWAGYGRGAGFTGVARDVATTHRRRGVRRGFLEKMLVFVVFIAVMAVVIPKLMIDTEHLSEAEWYDQIERVEIAVRSIPKRMKQFVDQDVLGAKPAPPSVPVVRPRLPPPATPVVPVFEPDKKLAHILTSKALASSLVFLRGGDVLAGALEDGSVQLWSAESGEWLRAFPAAAKGRTILSASPDGQWLARIGSDNAVRLWSAVDDKLMPALSGHADAVNAAVFSPDNKWLATGGSDKKVMLWDVETGTGTRTLTTRAAVLALAFAPNGRMLAAADADGGLQYWDMPSGTELAYAVAPEDVLTVLAYSPDGRWLAGAGQQDVVRLWRIGVERDDRTIKGVPGVVNSLVYSPDSKWLLVAGTTAAIEIRSTETGEVAKRLGGHASAVQALAISADGQWLASADGDSKIRLWR